MLRRCLFLPALAALIIAAAPPARARKANRLARSSSPYLLQHAHNPVDWFPWGEEAFRKARKEGKLVFLSIGYSSCHWCHVMEKESFANAEVARILNKHFVCIKVDREERPDIDQVYMTALHALGQSGGWPLSMFLDARGRPILGGTYWPREDREEDGKVYAGFKRLLLRIQELHEKQPKDLEEQAEKLSKATAAALAGRLRGVALIELDRKLIDGVVEGLKEEFDRAHGGFGNAERKFRGPKFPMPATLVFLQREAKRAKAKDLDAMVETTLDQMALGGIYDHLGGGFARYAVERTWTVPHFEKMLYDNAQLLEVYAEGLRRTKKPLYRRVLRQTIDWLAREMTAPGGGFYSALDADSEGEEGRFYVWTAKELAAALPDRADLKLFRKAYGAEGGYNFEGRYHVLRLPAPPGKLAAELGLSEDQLEGKLAPLRKKLLDVRARRPRPFLDTKVLTAWNGQMIAGLAQAGQALGDRKATEAAVRAARFVLATMKTKEGRLLRSYAAAPGEEAAARLNGYLDDYAYLVHGLLTLHDVTGEKGWLEEAKALTAAMVKFHADGDRGGFFYTSSDHEKLFARAKDQFDGAQPAGNSVAARNLVRLWEKTGEARYAQLAEKTFKALSPVLKTSPTNLCLLADALNGWLEKKGEKK
jgi:uncharacterized protein YyaL (SSP411 family)